MKKREEIIVRLTFKFSSATLQKKNEDLHFPHKQKTAKLEDSVQEKTSLRQTFFATNLKEFDTKLKRLNWESRHE